MDGLNPETVGTAVFMITTMVVGATELVKRVAKKDYETAAIILVAVLVGALTGALLFPSVGLAGGIVLGLSGTGVVTGLAKIGSQGKSE